MSDAMTFILVYKVRGQLGIFLLDKVLYFLTQIAYDKDEFVDTRLQELVEHFDPRTLEQVAES